MMIEKAGIRIYAYWDRNVFLKRRLQPAWIGAARPRSYTGGFCLRIRHHILLVTYSRAAARSL